MFPYRDENVTLRTPVATIALIVVTVGVWIVVQGGGSTLAVAESVCNYGLVAAELTRSVAPGTPFPMGEGLACVIDPGTQPEHLLTHMFLHGSWMHLLGNMWFLWIFGNNVEDSMGRLRFVVFYLVCGLVAAFVQVWMTPTSGAPMVGASGAISGVMGAYVVLYPFVRVFVLVWLGFFITTIALPAWTMIGYWALLQLLSGVGSLWAQSVGGVAFWAHLGGLVAGVFLVPLFARRDYVEEHRSQHWEPSRYGWR